MRDVSADIHIYVPVKAHPVTQKRIRDANGCAEITGTM